MWKKEEKIVKLKGFIPLFALILCCIIVAYWAVTLTMKVDKLRDDVNGLSTLLTQKIININNK